MPLEDPAHWLGRRPNAGVHAVEPSLPRRSFDRSTRDLGELVVALDPDIPSSRSIEDELTDHPLTFPVGRAVRGFLLASTAGVLGMAIMYRAAFVVVPAERVDPLAEYFATYIKLLKGGLAMAVVSVAVSFWRLRLDGTGISRRWLFWRDIWPWKAFRLGRVVEVEDVPITFVLPEKPPWLRRLSIGFLDDEAGAVVLRTIRTVLPPQEVPDPPEELALRLPLRQEMVVSRSGLSFADRHGSTRYAWDEVRRLCIRRLTHDRPDFRELELALPDRTIRLTVGLQNGQASRPWSAPRGSPTPSSAQVAGALQRYMPRDRVQVTALEEPPRTIAEWQDRRSILDARGREVTLIGGMTLCLCLLPACLVPMAIVYRGDWILAAAGAVLVFVFLGPLYAVAYVLRKRRQHRDVAELNAHVPEGWQREGLAANADPSRDGSQSLAS
jgi:hypothetical protein